ncbi:sensor histidine kinase family protein, partial [Marinilabilia sp.]
MKNSLHKLLAGLTVLLLFPVVIAVFYEYSRINDSEKLISTVYKNQLETIVSSINSYVQDVADNWGSRLEMGLKFAEDTSGIERLVSENKSINGIYLSATDQQTETIYQKNADGLSQDSLNLFLLNNQDEVIRLKNYYKNGYQKFVSHFLSKEHVVLFFVGEGRNNQLQVFLIDVNLPLFLQNHIRPRIQSIARDNFLIALYLKNREEILVSTEKSISQNQEYDQKGEMWLFPFLEIGITLKEQTIADLARSRIKEGLILMGIVLFVLVGGVWFLFSSVKREIQLTQIKSEFIANVSHEI